MQQQLGLQLGAPAATGPEIAEAVKAVFRAAGAPIVWEEQHIGKTVDERTNSFVTRENLDSVLVRVAHARQHPPAWPTELQLCGIFATLLMERRCMNCGLAVCVDRRG